eukprot:1258118-Pyramimonas_sp.AAC.1
MFETRTGATVRRLELRARNTEAGLEDSACFEARSMPRSLTKDNVVAIFANYTGKKLWCEFFASPRTSGANFQLW